MEETTTDDRQCVAEEGDVHVHVAVDRQCSCILAGHTDFGHGIIMQQLALSLAQLSAHTHRVLVVFHHTALGVRQLEVAQVVAHESLQSRFSPLAESLQRSQRQGVLHLPVLGVVVDGVALVFSRRVVFVQIVVGRCLIGDISTAVVVELQGVYKACHRHVFVFHPGRVLSRLLLLCHDAVGGALTVHGDALCRLGILLVGSRLVARYLCVVGSSGKLRCLAEGILVELLALLASLFPCLLLGVLGGILLLRGHGKLLRLDLLVGHAHLSVESHIVPVVEEHVYAVVSVPVLLQHGRNLVLGIGVFEEFWVLDVVVVGDSAVLCRLLVQGREEQVRLVSVAYVRSPHGIFEVRGALAVVVATSVLIVESESHAQSFSRVDGKHRLEVVLAVGTVSAAVERHVGDGRGGVGEVEFADGRADAVEGLCEDKLPLVQPSVDKDTVDAGRAQIAQRVVFSPQSRGEWGVHVHVLQGVHLCLLSVAESLVYGPHLQSLGYFLVRP